MPNADGAGYYRFTQPAADGRALEAAFAELNDREQLMAADSAAAAFHAGRVAPEASLRTLPRLAASRSWPAASVPAGTLEWMREHLAGAAEREALDALARDAYGPRLAALSPDERAEEPDEAKLERQALVALLAHAGDAALRAELAARARAALAAGLDGAALAANQRASALEVLAQDGSDAEFAALESALRASTDSLLRRDLARAIGAARQPARGRRARALALDPALRSGELSTLLGSHFAWPENRPIARAWFRGNLAAILERLPTLAAASAPAFYAAGACSESDARDVATRFAEPLAALEGGPRALAQLAEAIRLCAALRAHHARAGFGRALDR